MFKKSLILAAIILILSSMAWAAPAAAWQPLNHTLDDIRLQRTKTAVVNGIDAAIGSLKAAEGGIERSKLTDGQKAGLKAEIESNITWFEAKKRDVESAKDVPGALQYAKQASGRWNDIYPALKKEFGLMSCDNFDAELENARGVVAVASSKINSLKAQGKDTGSIEKALGDYNGHVDSASRYAAVARSEFSSVDASRQDGHFAAGLKQLGLAGGEMKSAYRDLKTIYRQLLGDSVKVA